MDPLTAALRYAKRGLRVFPIHGNEGGSCACGTTDCRDACKHPIGALVPHGCKDATTDPQTIKEWFALYQGCNVGIATGDGLAVLDIDADRGGEESLRNLKRKHGPPPLTWLAVTGSGYHLYFASPWAEVRNSAGALGPGLDVRGEGGYVVAPPSVHQTGVIYQWSVSPKDTPLAELPEWLIPRQIKANGRFPSAPRIPRVIPQGQRNTTIASLCGSLRRYGADGRQMLALAEVVNARCDPPLSPDELAAVCRSMERYAPESAPIL
jgi:hypothetical protein